MQKHLDKRIHQWYTVAMQKAARILRWILLIFGTVEIVAFFLGVLISGTFEFPWGIVLFWLPVMALCIYYERKYKQESQASEEI